MGYKIIKVTRGALLFPEADMTLTGLVSLLLSSFDGAGLQCDKLLSLTHSSQPKAVEVGKVVTGSLCTLALYKRVSSEILKAATRRCQRLATTFITCSSVLNTERQQEQSQGFLLFFFLSYIQSNFFIHSPGGKSTLSTDSSNQVGMQGLCDPGYGKPLLMKLSHTQHSG